MAGYQTIVTVKLVPETGAEPMTSLDEMQHKLRDAETLDFLRSKAQLGNGEIARAPSPLSRPCPYAASRPPAAGDQRRVAVGVWHD